MATIEAKWNLPRLHLRAARQRKDLVKSFLDPAQAEPSPSRPSLAAAPEAPRPPGDPSCSTGRPRRSRSTIAGGVTRNADPVF